MRLAWTDRDGCARETRAARVLAAAGRPPNLDCLNPGAAGLRLGKGGVIEFDRRGLVCPDAPVLIARDADAWRPVEAPEPWPAPAMVFTTPTPPRSARPTIPMRRAA